MSISESLDFIRIDHPSRKPFVAGVVAEAFKASAKMKFFMTKDGKCSKSNSLMAFEMGMNAETIRSKKFRNGMKLFPEYGLIEFQTEALYKAETRTMDQIFEEAPKPKKNIPITATCEDEVLSFEGLGEASRYLKIDRVRISRARVYGIEVRALGKSWKIKGTKDGE